MSRTCAKCALQGRKAIVVIVGAMGQTSTPVLRPEDGHKKTGGNGKNVTKKSKKRSDEISKGVAESGKDTESGIGTTESGEGTSESGSSNTVSVTVDDTGNGVRKDDSVDGLHSLDSETKLKLSHPAEDRPPSPAHTVASAHGNSGKPSNSSVRSSNPFDEE